MVRHLGHWGGVLGALWSLLALVSPVPTHVCPTVPAATPTQESTHQHHAAHAGSTPAPDQSHSDHPVSGECTCINCGCAAAPVAGVFGTSQRVVTATLHRDAPVVQRDHSHRPEPIAHVLPFANGPPALIG